MKSCSFWIICGVQPIRFRSRIDILLFQGYVSKYNVISANDLTIKLEMFFTQQILARSMCRRMKRVIEICNKAE